MASKDYVREQIDDYRKEHAAEVRQMIGDATEEWDRLQAEREKRIDERHKQNLEWLQKIEHKLESLSDALGRSRGH